MRTRRAHSPPRGGSGGSPPACGRLSRTLGALAAACAVVCGCSDAKRAEPRQVEIFSWWVSAGEVEALDALVAIHRSSHPDVTVKNLAADFSDQAHNELKNRMAAGVPPDSFQANIGWGLLTWAPAALEPLDDLAREQGWASAFEPAVLASASRGGSLYGVALNIHRINALFYNPAVLAKHGVAPPTTLDELESTCAPLRAAGVIPIALGNLNRWTLVELVFECVLVAVAGPQFYERYWSGKEEPDAPAIAEAFERTSRLFAAGCFNADNAVLDWTDAVGLVADGRAAFTEMGDWAKGYLESRGKVADRDFGAAPFPGTSGVFVYTSDTFSLPRGARHRSDTLELLATMGSPAGQLAFNRKKGSIPARTDLDPSTLDAMQQRTYADWKTRTKALAMSGLTRVDALPDLGATLRDAMAIGDRRPVVDYLTNKYSTLK